MPIGKEKSFGLGDMAVLKRMLKAKKKAKGEFVFLFEVMINLH